jgi:hypothetical protein
MKEVTVHIMKSIQTTGRFLRKTDGQWILASEREIRQKIAHAIQYRNRNSSAESEPQPQQMGHSASPTSNLSIEEGGIWILDTHESMPSHGSVQNQKAGHGMMHPTNSHTTLFRYSIMNCNPKKLGITKQYNILQWSVIVLCTIYLMYIFKQGQARSAPTSP